ncbi:helix-turn-helix domain-containing protein [Streptomyces sp. CC224B]|uniref:helix-turn-helix domain-containing protein n=1 Tax=Streptomyces sp. CC224B TaxID=3044571 RepID=UPI0024A9CE27|nr:helix-turn-helix domain-containing protein [Streptomyces sp. CC224B]
MKRRTEATPRYETRATAEQFAAWLRDQLTRRGYDLGPRGGGQTKFAEDSGIGRATISRILSGKGSTETRNLALLAEALTLPLPEVLIAAGIISAAELDRVRAPQPRQHPLTPEEAADELGIHDPQARRVFIATTETLQRTPPHNGEGRTAEN